MKPENDLELIPVEETKRQEFLPPDYLRETNIGPDEFIRNYDKFLPLYIHGNRPSVDTLATYTTSINLFLAWCSDVNIHPFAVHDMQMRLYVTYLKQRKGLSDNTVCLKVSAIRTFYRMAVKIGYVQKNPCEDVQTPTTKLNDLDFKYYTIEQLREICDTFLSDDPVVCARNTLIVYLMGVEGLRSVEVMRLSDEDIDYEEKKIFIKGKGHGGLIFPCDQTMDHLAKYVRLRGAIPKDEFHLTPLIVCLGNRAKNKRITRDGLRRITNKALSEAGIKFPGHSCHTLRHSCATNLYKVTRDLRVVQETLRHKNPQITSRYAHVQERAEKRYTKAIVPTEDAKP